VDCTKLDRTVTEQQNLLAVVVCLIYSTR
jgi:hypothetical protein